MITIREDSLKPFLQRISFSNTKLEPLERGDILYFGYSGDREDTIINPCIIFSGVNKKTGFLEGVNLRMFYADKRLNIGKAVLERYGKIYWSEVENDDDDDVILEKKKVGYTASNAFVYENLGIYKIANVTSLVNNERKQVNLMEEYWRSYDPKKMRLLSDSFTKLTNGKISINLQVASVIIHDAPTRIVTQSRIEA